MFDRFSKALFNSLSHFLLRQWHGTSGDERLLISGYSPEVLEALFEEILTQCTGSREFALDQDGAGKTYAMKTWRLPDAKIEVLPYLIVSSPQTLPEGWTPNAGTANFAGTLRDHYKRAFTGTDASITPILLVIDSTPAEAIVETIGSAMHPLVGPGRPLDKPSVLLQNLTDHHGEDAAALIIKALVPGWKEVWDEFTEHDLEKVFEILEGCRPERLIEDFGAGLAALGDLLPDPDLTPQTLGPKRLKQNRDLVTELEEAFRPQGDAEDFIRGRYNPETAEDVLQAVVKGRLNLQALTFKQLLDSRRSTQPSKIRLSLVEDQDFPTYHHGNVYVVPINFNRERLHFAVRASSPIGTMHIDIKDTFPRDLTVDGPNPVGDKEVNFSIQTKVLDRSVPTMLSVGLYRTPRSRKKITELILVMIPSAAGDAAFEGSLKVDIAEGAFIVPSTNEAQIYYMDLGGRIKGPPPSETFQTGELVNQQPPLTVVLPPSISDHSEVHEVTLTLRQGHLKLRFYAEQEVETPESPDMVGSVPHALLHLLGSLSDNDELSVDVLRKPIQLTTIDQMEIAGRQLWIPDQAIKWLSLEQEILLNPRTVSWSLIKDGDYDFKLQEGSQQDDWGNVPSTVEPVLLARQQLFEAVLEAAGADAVGSSILLLDLRSEDQTIKTVVDAAKSYIQTYDRALHELIQTGALFKDADNWLLFMDTLFVYDTSENLLEIILLPYHPLNLAHMIGLYDTIDKWLETGSTDVDYIRFAKNEPDPRRFSPAGLVPAFKYKGTWYTIAETTDPLLAYWPCYRREDHRKSQPGDYQGSVIREKIQQFLNTYPMLLEPKGKVALRINLVNPGTGSHIVKALTDFYKKYGDDSPIKIHLTLISDDPLAGSELDRVFADADGDGQEYLDTIRKNVTYGRMDARQNPPYAHITFLTGLYNINYDHQEAIDRFPDSLFHHGLMPQPARYLVRDEGDVYFRYMTHTWVDIDGEHPLEWQHWLRTLAANLQCLTTYQGGQKIQPGFAAVRTVSIHPNQLHAPYYENSLWVVHLDREIGLELFQTSLSEDGKDAKPFVIDYSDQYDPDVEGYDAITTTSHLVPYIEAVRAILGTTDPSAAQRTLRILNLLSGRWALRLVNTSDTTVRERLGNVLAFEYLNHEEDSVGVTGDRQALRLVMSLEEFLRLTPAIGLPLKHGLHRKIKGEIAGGSDDLFLVTIERPDENGNVTVRGRIIEVKYGTSDVYKGVDQVIKTFATMNKLFGSPRRSDWLLRATDLASFIHSNISRYVNYGFITDEQLHDFGYYSEIYPALTNGRFSIHFTYPDDDSGQELVGDVINLATGMNFFRKEIAAGTQVCIITLPEPWWRQLLQGTDAPTPIKTVTQTSAPEPSSPAQTRQQVPTEPVQPLKKTSVDDRPPVERSAVENTPIDVEGPIQPRTATVDSAVSRTRLLAQTLADTDEDKAVPVLTAEDLEAMGDHLGRSLRAYGIKARQVNMEEIETSATVVRFKVILEPGETLAKVQRHAKDLARELAAVGDLSISNIPGTPYIGIDVPRRERGMVTLAGVIQAPEFEQALGPDKLVVPLGEGLGGKIGFFNLVELPHLLVAGSTGSGKTVFLYTIILSLCTTHSPQSLQLILVDPKRVDLTLFRNLPHLWHGRIIHDPEEAIYVLQEGVLNEIARRQDILEQAGHVNLSDYNEEKEPEAQLPRMVVIIDEFADLVATLDSSSRKTFEERVQRIAQIGRALGVHLVVATQRPSTDVITGTIRANIPGRASFRLPSHHDSSTVLDEPGAETLLGKGDMLFKWEGAPVRYQAPFISTRGVRAAVDLISEIWS